MREFYEWLKRNGFVHTRGDIHFNNSGWWYPAPPENLSADNATLPGSWIWVQEDKANPAVFIDRQGLTGREGLGYTDNSKKAIEIVNTALMQFFTEADDMEGGSFAGVYPNKGALVGKLVRVDKWNPPFTGRIISQSQNFCIVRREDDDRLVTVGVGDVKPMERGGAQALDGFNDFKVPKTCTTCGKHYSEVGWQKLPLVGTQVIEADTEGPGYSLELRNCTCGSTLAVELG